MRVLGIDPGLAITGYAIVVEDGGDEPRALTYGAIRTPAGQPVASRLAQLYTALCAIVEEYRPQALAVGNLFFGRNVTTAFMVGQARGVVLLCAAQHGLRVAEYKPTEIKQALVGYGNADKRQVQYMVRAQLGLEETPRPDDVADALAVAVCHIFTARFQARTME